MALDLFQELGAAPPPPVNSGRDLFREFGVSAQPARGDSEPSADRDLFAELGIKVEPGLLERAKSAVVDAGRFVAGAVKQTGQDIANLTGSQPSVMKDEGRDLLAEFGLADASSSRANPRDVAVGQRLVQSIIDEGLRRDIGTMKPEDRVTDAPFRQPTVRVRPEGVLPRTVKDIASGVTGLGAGFAGAAEWMTGVPSTTTAAKYLEAVTQNLTPDDPDFGDQLAAGAGSFAGFFLPGLGIAKGAQAVGKVSTVLANWLGAGASAGLEAASEAGSVYRQLRQQGKTPEEASRAATGVFWSNAALVGVTNKLGLFSETGGAIRRGATSAAMEGTQEYGQQIISNVATGQPATEGAGTAAAIGAILGGGAGAAMGARGRPAPAREITNAEVTDQQARAPVDTSGAAAVEPASTAASIVQPPVGPAQPAAPPQPIVTPATGNAVAPVSAPASMMAESPGVPAATTTGADLFEQLGVTPPTMEQGAVDQAAPIRGPYSGLSDEELRKRLKQALRRQSVGPRTVEIADIEREAKQRGVELYPRLEKPSPVDAAAHEAATSPGNALPEPTDAQKEAGNYAKGHVRIGGLDISIENPIGSERTGVDRDGKPWSVTMAAHYGYVRRTEGKDGEQVDVYIAEGTPQDWSGPAFVVDQVNPSTGRFDEHKVIIGTATREEAARLYDAHFSDASGPSRRAAITQMPMQEFKQWLKDGNLKAPVADLDTIKRNAPEAPTARAEDIAGNMPRAIAQAPDSAQPRGAGSASEVGATPPLAASTQQAWPSDVPTVVYRGSGRATKGAAYGGVAVPIAGEGRYFAFSREAAKRYGPNIEEVQAPVRNPLVIRSGEEWRTLTREAGWGVPNIFGMAEEKIRDRTQRLKEVVQSKGHDGLIIHWDDSVPYDIDPKTGANIKLLRNVFGEPQVVAYAATVDFTRIRGGQPLMNPRDGYAVSATGLPEGQYLVSPAGPNVTKERSAWPFQPFVTDENGVRAFASRSRATQAPSTSAAQEAPRAVLASPPIDKPASDLAATAVGRRTYAPPATATERVDTDQARPDQIREAIRQLFNVPINEKHITIRRAAGIYKVKPQTIRVRNHNDLDVITHEVGHHFSETKPRVRGLMKKHEGELLAITPDAYAKEPKALRLEEGGADFFRLYLTQQSEAKRLAPGFMKDFNAFVNDNPHYRAAFDQVRGMVDQWFKLDPVERIMAKVGGRPRSIAERLGEAFGKDRLIFEVFDQWNPLRLMVADLKPGIAASVDPYRASHLLSGDAAIIEDWLTSGTVPFDYAKRADPANYGKPLHDILKPVAKKLRPFSAYLIAKRADELKRHGKENLFTDEEIAAGLALETPALKAAADEIYAYNDRLLDYAVEGGLLSKDAAAKFREYTAYIPFFREAEDGAGGARSGSVFRRLLGGTENLRDPISNIIQNTANIVHATNRNVVLAKAYQLAQSVPGGGRWIEAIPMPKKAVQVATERILEQLKKEGVTIDTTMAEDLAAMQTFFQPNTLGDDRHRITVVKINGEPKALQVNNRMLWQALQAFEPLDLGLVGTMLAVPSDLLRAGVTLSPEFMARNFMRDTLSGFIQSKPGMVPMIGTVGGFKEVATRSDAYKLYRAFGGAYGDLWKGESEQTRKTLERMAKRGKFDPRTILTPSGIIDVLHRLGSVSEAGTRVAEFKKTAEGSDVDSLIDAAYNAREVSVDFGMHGHNKTVRLLTRITPFLNPAMQGFYKMGRTGREQFFTTLLRGSMLTAFSVALYLMNRDKDWYDDIEQWEKDVYWHFDVGLRDKEDKVIPLRLPKPFEWGAVFGSIPEALTQVATDLEGSKFGKRLVSIWNNVFAIRAVPTAALVPAELWANKNTFTDRPIVPESKEKLDPELQFTPGTSLTAREVGQATGTSPAQIDHTVRGFLGTMGVYSVMLADQALRLAGDYPEPPAPSWRQMPVVKAFVRDPDNPNSRHVNEFYELLNKARRAEASHKKYEGGAADAYYAKHKAVMDIATDANQAAREIAGLRKDSEDITSSREYTGQEKRQLINDNSAMIREIAKGINVGATR